jgi:putative transposase
VVSAIPDHVTQQGNRRQPSFFCDDDYRACADVMGEKCGAHQVESWVYRLMPNRVHLITVPQSAAGLSRAIGEAHRRYTRIVSFCERWRVHFWQGWFTSLVLNEPSLLTEAQYIELNPLRAGLLNAPIGYARSSAAAHARVKNDPLVRVAPELTLVPNWHGFLARVIREEVIEALRAHERIGRPPGDDALLATLE